VSGNAAQLMKSGNAQLLMKSEWQCAAANELVRAQRAISTETLQLPYRERLRRYLPKPCSTGATALFTHVNSLHTRFGAQHIRHYDGLRVRQLLERALDTAAKEERYGCYDR
jgi:sugar diacid utilization regulator